MKKYPLELGVGVFVLIGLVCLGYLTIKLGKLEIFSSKGYTVSARFSSITGLKVGAAVEIAGVPVGKVSGIALDKDYYADIYLRLDEGVTLSDDSIASVKTSGLIGDKYVSISRGGSDAMLTDGDEITETEPPLDIEALIGKYIFGGIE